MSNLVFNGTSSDELGVRIISKNVYSSPKYDITLVSIPGRDGEIVSDNGRFPNVTVSYSCFLPAKSIDELAIKIRNVKKWLYSDPGKYHDLSDSFDSQFYRKAIFNSKLDVTDQISKIGVFTITFSCYPFKYAESGDERLILETGDEIFNPYPFNSKPYLKINGSGTGTLRIENETEITSWVISNIDGYVECDSELMNFYKGTLLKNSDVVGDKFPTLAYGANTITFSGGITSVEIIPRWISL